MARYDRFARYYDAMYDGIVDYAGDCDYLGSLFRKFHLRPRAILDLGCGTGNHAIELARRGYEVTGLDLSSAQLRIACGKAGSRKLAVRFVRGDMARFSLRGRFDAAISMFGGFGYLLTDRQFASHFASVRRHLATDGLYTFEFWHLPAALDHHCSWLHRPGPPEVIRLDKSRTDRARRRLTMEFQVLALDGRRVVDRFTEVHTVRLYTMPEMRALLDTVGFTLLGAYPGTPQRKGFGRVRRDTFRITSVVRPSD